MSVFRFGLAVFLGVFLCVSPRAAHAQVSWNEGSLDNALHSAAQQHQQVLLDFSASWCAPCQTMEATVWNRPEISSVVQGHWFPLRVDADAPDGAALQQRFHVRSLPALIALRADGTEFDRLSGEADRALVLSVISAWNAGHSTVSALEARLQQTPNDLALRRRVALALLDSPTPARAVPLLEAIATQDANNERGLAAEALWLLAERVHARAGQHAQVSARIEELRRRFPRTTYALRSTLLHATTLRSLGRAAEGRQELSLYVSSAEQMDVRTRYEQTARVLMTDRWDLPEAERLLRFLATHGQRDGAVLHSLSEAVSLQGRNAEAISIAQEAVRLAPGNEHYRTHLQTLQHAAQTSGPAPAVGSSRNSDAGVQNAVRSSSRTPQRSNTRGAIVRH